MENFFSLLQTSGEAVYSFDKTLSQVKLHGAFILSDIGKMFYSK
jgi:hypothetical protein